MSSRAPITTHSREFILDGTLHHQRLWPIVLRVQANTRSGTTSKPSPRVAIKVRFSSECRRLNECELGPGTTGGLVDGRAGRIPVHIVIGTTRMTSLQQRQLDLRRLDTRIQSLRHEWDRAWPRYR